MFVFFLLSELENFYHLPHMSEVRRSSRTSIPAMNPEERLRPLVERGGMTNRAEQTTEAVPESTASQTSEREQITEPSVSDPPPLSNSGPDVIDLSSMSSR